MVHRFRNVSALSLVFLFLVVSSSAKSDELAVQVLEKERALVLDRLWPEFEPLDIAVALFDGNKTILARHPNPPGEFSPLPDHEGLFFCPGRHPQVVANTTAVINDHRTATLLLNPDPCLKELAAIVVHESFHVFQWQGHKDWLADEAVTFTYPVEDVSGLVYRRLEARALYKAICSEDDAQALAWAKGAMELRKKRFTRLTEDQRAYDRGFELLEGTAYYVEYQSLGRASTRLAEEIEASDVRSRNYATGQALCVLLDRFSPEWKKQLNQGPKKNLDEFLLEVICKMKVSPHLPDEALMAEMQKKAATDIQEIIMARQAERKTFTNAEGWTLVIEVDNPDNLFWPSGFDPMNVTRLSEKEVLHTRMLHLSGQAGSFEAMDQTSLTVAKGPHPLYNGVIKIMVTGIEKEPDIEETKNKLLISTPKTKTCILNAEVERAERKVTVRL